jgi:lysozyme family protein
MPTTYGPALKAEYEALYASAAVRPERVADVDAVVQRITAPLAWSHYKGVERETGVPAHVVGIIHMRESGGNFGSHLHNGDPLSARTKRVPPGRPVEGDPPFTWTESAIDALTMPGQGLDKWHDWSIGGICFVLERYNGFGYRNRRVNSPYLWSYTTAYERGMYIADGVWSSTAVNKAPGGMAILKRMVERGVVSIDGAKPTSKPGVRAIDLRRAEQAVMHFAKATKRLQERLTTAGFDPGPADSIWGPRTAAALIAYMKAYPPPAEKRET